MKNILRSLTKRTNAHERGQVMIEFALVFPVVVLLLLGTVDLARAVYAYGVISNAARDGAHWGSLRPLIPSPPHVKYDVEHGDFDYAAVRDRAKANAKTLDEDRIDATPQCSYNPQNPYMEQFKDDPTLLAMHECDSWNFLTVTVKYQFQPITLFFIPFTLKSESTMTIE